MNKPRVALATLAIAGLLTGIVVAREFAVLKVSSESMRPSFCEGDYVLVHRLRSPEPAELRGQAVVFSRGPGALVTKRIVALEGDHVEFSPRFIRFNKLDSVSLEQCPARATLPDNVVTHRQFDIPKGYAFLLGDNYGLAEDSRQYGAVPLSAVVGKVVTRIPTTFSPCPCGYQPGAAP